MKIAIIGAGWVGCHLASSFLSKGIEFTVFDKNGVFSSTSFNNQNRLHLGFHYARSKGTRILCKNTFNTFKEHYPTLTSKIDDNLYYVHKNSILDLGTYKDIFSQEEISYNNHPLTFSNCEGGIKVEEEYIDFIKGQDYFKQLLKNNISIEEVTDPNLLLDEYDFVINCTNNVIPNPKAKSVYELCLCLVYKKQKPINFGALTLVDGPFFSLYPYKEDLYTLTDVENTPLFTSKEVIPIDYKDPYTLGLVEERTSLMEEKVLEVLPDFKSNFTLNGFYLSLKSKIPNSSANRSPIISTSGKIIHAFTGKIQGIFQIEKVINEYINQ